MEPNAIGQEGFYAVHRLGLFLLSLGMFALVLELVRRGFLKERYALLWLAVAACGLFVGIFPGIIARLSLLLEFQYLTVVSMFAFLFLVLLVLVFSVVLSRLSERTRELAQEVTLLTQRLERMERDDAD